MANYQFSPRWSVVFFFFFPVIRQKSTASLAAYFITFSHFRWKAVRNRWSLEEGHFCLLQMKS